MPLSNYIRSRNKYEFGVIVRTQAKHLHLLTEALQSLAFQASKSLAIVVLHEDAHLLVELESACNQISNLDYVLLHAADKSRKRGYPLNVGLQYCYKQDLEIDGIFFLDDDDIVYPFFTSKMKQAFLAKNADVIYAASNCRRPGMQAEEGYRPKHISHIFIENCVPINSYAVRYSALRDKNILFDEELDYTEDWMFLLKLLEHGFRFEAIESTLSEFRIISDGNTTIKRHPELWKQASARIRNYINKSKFCLNGYVVASFLRSLNARMAALDTQIVVLENKIRELESDLTRVRSERDFLLQEREVFERKVVRFVLILSGRFRRIYSNCRKLIKEFFLMFARTIWKSSDK